MKLDLPYLMRVRDRKRRWLYYVRRDGKLTRVHGERGSAEFLASYQKALGRDYRKPVTGTWRWLCEQYIASPEWGELARSTQRARELVLQSTWAEPMRPGEPELFGACRLADFGAQHVRVLRDRKKEAPDAANNRIKAVRAVFRWAIEVGHYAEVNPALGAKGLKSKRPDGHHTWTVGEVERYCARHPVGTKARLALAVFLFTGARISDVARFGRPMVQAGQLCWTEAKGAARTPKEREIPILPELQAVLDATTLTGTMTWLVTQYGKPFTVKGLGQWFRKRCNEAGLPHCSAHGLRKAGATIAAENGATNAQLKAVFGWTTDKQVAGYTRAADNKRLARDAIGLLVRRD